jgi:hypothetical protein
MSSGTIPKNHEETLLHTANNVCWLWAVLIPFALQVPPLRFLKIGGNSIGDDGAAMVGAGLVEAAGLGLLMLRFFGLDNNSMYDQTPDAFVTESLCINVVC